MITHQFNAKVFKNPYYFIASGFGVGLLPIAPGTWGTLLAIPLYWFLASFSLSVYLGITGFALITGALITEKVTQELGEHDYSGIVWDEIVGYLFTMTAIPRSLTWAVLGFFLFRLFDIWKPQPIRYIDQKIGGGWGIMLDDVVAALFAWVVLQIAVMGIFR